MADPVQPPGHVSKKAYAEHRGCSPAYISKLIRIGRLAFPALLPNGRIVTTLADQMLGDPVDDTAPLAHLGTDAGPNYAVERARREAAQAQLKELQLQRERGESLSIAQVEREVFAKDRRIRDAILAAAEAVAARAHAALNAQAAADIIRAALQAALETLADDMEADAQPG